MTFNLEERKEFIMDKFANNINTLIEACTPYAWILPVLGFLIIGVALAIPSEKTKEFAKGHWAFVILGTMLVAGAIYMGNWIFGKISF